MPDLIATGIIPAVFCVAIGLWAVTAFGRWLDRHDAEQQNLAVGIADERRHIEDEPAEEIVLDPPVAPGTVIFRGRLVHKACLTWWLRGGLLRDECKVHLTDDVQAGAV